MKTFTNNIHLHAQNSAFVFLIKVGVIFLLNFWLDSQNPVNSIPLLLNVLTDDPHPCRCVVFCSFSP